MELAWEVLHRPTKKSLPALLCLIEESAQNLKHLTRFQTKFQTPHNVYLNLICKRPVVHFDTTVALICAHFKRNLQNFDPLANTQ